MQVVDKVCNILLTLSKQPNMSSSEIAQTMDLSVPTAHRLLAALARHGMVEKDIKTKRYTLGWTLACLGQNLQVSSGQAYVINRLMPYVKALAAETRETATLTYLSGNRAVLVAKEEGDQALRFSSSVGREMPWHAAAPAKLLLALQPNDIRKKILGSLTYERFTPNTVCDAETLKKQLEELARTKLSYCVEEMDRYCLAISVPIYAGREAPIFALSVAGYYQRMQDNDKVLIDILKDMARRAEEMLAREGIGGK